jgi:hypothetical protein
LKFRKKFPAVRVSVWLSCLLLVGLTSVAFSQTRVHFEVKIVGPIQSVSGLVFRISESNVFGSIVIASKDGSDLAYSVINLPFFPVRESALKPLDDVKSCHLAKVTFADTRVDFYRDDGSLDAENSGTLKNQVIDAHVSPTAISGCTIGPSGTVASGSRAQWTKLPSYFTNHVPTSVPANWEVNAEGRIRNLQTMGGTAFDPGYGNCNFDLYEDGGDRHIHLVYFRDNTRRTGIRGPYEDQSGGNSDCAYLKNGEYVNHYTRPKTNPTTHQTWYYVLT